MATGSKVSRRYKQRFSKILTIIELQASHSSHLTSKCNLLLDATLGLINIEQNQIIKIFSVVAVVFLPPTLIASTYGMNFTHLPELDWELGYPFSLALMVISAIIPLLYFKKKRWL
jgi:magnesium transporter